MSASDDLTNLADEHGLFKTILIDAPWPSDIRKPKPGRGQWLAEHTRPRYGTMSMADIANLPVSDIAEDDAMLVMWVTWMHLPLAFPLIKLWGFKYATGFPWLKVRRADLMPPATRPDGTRTIMAPIYGPGVWVQHCTEIVLLSRRGHPFGKMGNPRPARKGIIVAPRQEHSRKPDELHEWIEAKFPDPKIEMFARRPRVGWTVWGNEV